MHYSRLFRRALFFIVITLAVATYASAQFRQDNTDIADGWEREGVDPRYFYEFSKHSYAVGINILLYAMTH
jgi:hypothetical protein